MAALLLVAKLKKGILRKRAPSKNGALFGSASRCNMALVQVQLAWGH